MIDDHRHHNNIIDCDTSMASTSRVDLFGLETSKNKDENSGNPLYFNLAFRI